MAEYANAMTQLGVEAAQWLIGKMRGNGIQSSDQIKAKDRQMGELKFSRFAQNTAMEKFEIEKEKVENFLREYLRSKKYHQDDIDQLVIEAKYVSRGSTETKYFQFVVGEGGQFYVSYVALKAEGDKVYILLTRSSFQFGLEPEKVTWFWFFTRTEQKRLTMREQRDLDNFLLLNALECFVGSISAVRQLLPAEDQQFLK